MRRLLFMAGLLAVFVAPATAAAQQSRPNGPWVEDAQHMSLERLHSYEELTAALQRIERRSHGRVQVESIGTSNEGRDIWLATVGTGDTPVMYITQQHGDEPLGTEAALKLLQRLGTTNGPEVQQILDELTLAVVVRANPDGAERFQRQNVDRDCVDPFCREGVGYDINRYHDPSLAPADNPVPEAAAIRRAYDRLQPAIVVDYHHQGTYVTEDGEMIRTSVFWPIAEGVDPAVVDASKQVAWLIADTLEHYGFADVSQYPGSTLAGIARNAFGLLGSASVLVELRGDIGQKSSGYLIRTAYASMFATLEAAADGTLTDIDPGRADTIPERGERITDE